MTDVRPVRIIAKKPSGYWKKITFSDPFTRDAWPAAQGTPRAKKTLKNHRFSGQGDAEARLSRGKGETPRSGSHRRKNDLIFSHGSKPQGHRKRSASASPRSRSKSRRLQVNSNAPSSAGARASLKAPAQSFAVHSPAAPSVVRLTDNLVRVDGKLFVSADPVLETIRADVGLRLQHAMKRVEIHNTLRLQKSKNFVAGGPPRLNLLVPNVVRELAPVALDPSISDADLVRLSTKSRGRGAPITDGALTSLLPEGLYPAKVLDEDRRVLHPAGPVTWFSQGSARTGLSTRQRRKGIVEGAAQLRIPVVVEGFYAGGGRRWRSVTPIVGKEL